MSDIDYISVYPDALTLRVLYFSLPRVGKSLCLAVETKDYMAIMTVGLNSELI